MSGAKKANIVLNIMAVVWCTLMSPSLPTFWRGPLMAAAILISLVLIVRGMRQSAGVGELDRKIFLLSVGFEVVAIPVAIYFLIAAHRSAFILPALAVIVGVHFIGMWLATSRRDYLWVCAAMCALGVVAVFLPPPLRMQVAGLGSALTLWMATLRISARP